jgi:hypothetical protein
MQKEPITKEQFLSLTLENISQVYSGQRNVCRCGCKGTYTATSFMANVGSEINDELIAKRLKRAQKLVAEGINDVDYSTTYIDIETGPGRCLCFYVNELKN